MKAKVRMWTAPHGWWMELRALGFSWERSESQPIADQTMLFGFTGPMDKLPEWVEAVQ